MGSKFPENTNSTKKCQWNLYVTFRYDLHIVNRSICISAFATTWKMAPIREFRNFSKKNLQNTIKVLLQEFSKKHSEFRYRLCQVVEFELLEKSWIQETEARLKKFLYSSRISCQFFRISARNIQSA